MLPGLIRRAAAAPYALAHARRLVASAAGDSWEVVVGLEIHCQIKTQSKLFSGAGTSFGAASNSQVALFDAALPGTLPAINRACVEAAVRTGFAVGGDISPRSRFDRKHYTYPDLPHGFQVTQKDAPIVTGGAVRVPLAEGAAREVRLERIQLEMDTGKSVHGAAGAGEGSRGGTAVDLNRAGSALLEIVSLPDMRSGDEAAGFVKELQQLLRHIGTSDGNMEEGSLRADVNVSVREVGGGGRSSTRCEVKNLNSLRSIQRAVEHEAARHVAALEAGSDVARETRTFDVAAGRTVPLRSKESLLDYRFMVEPDLPPLVLRPEEVEAWRKGLTETPAETLTRLQSDYGISEKQAKALMLDLSALPLFEGVLIAARAAADAGRVVAEGPSVARWLTGEVVGAARAAGAAPSLTSPSANPARLVELLCLVGEGTLSTRQAKPVLASLLGGDSRPVAEIAGAVAGGAQLVDEEEIRAQCVEILEGLPDQVAAFKGGRDRLMGLFVGELMKRTKGRANPQQATRLFKEAIEAGAGGAGEGKDP